MYHRDEWMNERGEWRAEREGEGLLYQYRLVPYPVQFFILSILGNESNIEIESRWFTFYTKCIRYRETYESTHIWKEEGDGMDTGE